MITDGVDNKYVDIDEEIPEGWTLGSSIQLTAEDKKARSVNMQGRIYIHNGTINKRIYENELSEYVKLGWKRGMYTERYDPDSDSFVDFRGKNNPFYGKKHSVETLIKLSNASKGRTHTMSDEAKKKISIANTGRIHTAESKKK